MTSMDSARIACCHSFFRFMWSQLALLPSLLQSVVCPARTTDLLLIGLLAWLCGLATGSVATAFALSPRLRHSVWVAFLAVLSEQTLVRSLPAGNRLRRYAA